MELYENYMNIDPHEANIFMTLDNHRSVINALTDKEWVAVVLKGSQNYGLDDEFSDIDSIVLVTPDFSDFVCGNKFISSNAHKFEDGGESSIKDIREFFRGLKKGNPNYLELLNTDYFIVNPNYSYEYNNLRYYKESIAHINELGTLNAVYGMMHQLNKKTDFKSISHIIRLSSFATKYMASLTYTACLDESDFDYLKKLKRGEKDFINSLCEDELVKQKLECLANVKDLINELQNKISHMSKVEYDKAEYSREVLTTLMYKTIEQILYKRSFGTCQ